MGATRFGPSFLQMRARIFAVDRSKILIGLVAVGAGVLLVLPALVAADSPNGHRHDVQGRMLSDMKGTYIGFDLKGKKKLKKVEVVIPVRCGSGLSVVALNVAVPGKTIGIKYPKRNGKVSKTGVFSAKLKTTFDSYPANLTVKGTINGKDLKGSAKLTVKSGDLAGGCSSGVADWSAKKGRRVAVLLPGAAGRIASVGTEGGEG